MVSTIFALCAHPFKPYLIDAGGACTSVPPCPPGYYLHEPPTVTCTQPNWANGGCKVETSNPNHCYIGSATMTVNSYVGDYDTVNGGVAGNKYTNPHCRLSYFGGGHTTITKKYGYAGAACQPEQQTGGDGTGSG